MPRKRITIAHQANPPRVTENPFANLFSDLLISDLVLPRLVGGLERGKHLISLVVIECSILFLSDDLL